MGTDNVRDRVMTCAGCGRAVYPQDTDASGRCCYCTKPAIEPAPAATSASKAAKASGPKA